MRSSTELAGDPGHSPQVGRGTVSGSGDPAVFGGPTDPGPHDSQKPIRHEGHFSATPFALFLGQLDVGALQVSMGGFPR